MKGNSIPLRTGMFSLVILLSFYSCSKETVSNEPKMNTISDRFKSYCNFDTASYWVYRDVNQQLTDTVMVRGYRTEQRLQVMPDQITSYRYEAILFDFDSGHMGLDKAEVIASQKQSTGDSLYERYRLYFSNGRYYTILAPEFPLNETQLFGEQEGSYTNVAFYNEFTLNGTSYQDVYRSSVKDYLNGPDTLKMEFWLARNIGLIWFTAKNTQTNIVWSLMESEVNNGK